MSDPQRDAADPRASAFVRANAGSGKTKTLIDRTARLLLAGAEPAAILCLTYTRAAAAEMQRRLFALLGGWSVLDDAKLREALAKLEGLAAESFTPAELSEARRLFARALETPGGLKIQTIHAFCERLLRRFPLEAGVAPGFEVADDPAAALLAAEARARVADKVLEGADTHLSEAYARMSVNLSFDAFQAMFATFEIERGGIRNWMNAVGGIDGLPEAVRLACGLDSLETPEVVEQRATLPPELDVGGWFAAARALSASKSKADIDRGVAYQRVAEAAGRGEAGWDEVEDLFLTQAGKPCAERSLFTQGIPDETKAWILAEQQRVCAAFEKAKANRVADETIWVMTLAFVYLEAYGEAKRSRGLLDFADLVERTVGLLAERPTAAWVLYKLDDGIDHILLDEAQDTAPDQWRILRGLTGEFFAGAARPSDRTIDRSLFIVGDNKQSIYSFQGAEPARLGDEITYYAATVEASGQEARTVELQHSWRSTREVLTFVDQVFAPPPLREAIQPGGSEVIHAAGRDDGPGCIDLWPPEEEETGAERDAWTAPLDVESETSAHVRLARRIADEIAALTARGDAVFDKALNDGKGGWRPAGFGDVLILVRRRGALFEDILRALKQKDIPVAGADRLALSAHIVFDDLLALARFALFPGDELTLAALLKSPFCGLDDDSLYALAFGRGRTNLWPLLERRAAQRPEWARAHRFLAGVITESRARRPFEFYGRLLAQPEESGRSGRQLLTGRLGAEASEAIDEFLAQVQGAEQRGARNLESLSHALGGLDIQVKRDMDEGAGQVRVMTTHGAKGLEAPIVILPEMTWDSRPRIGPLLKTSDGGYLWCSSKSADCLPSAAARQAGVDRHDEEQLRLLYVALTRARDRLILCGRVGVKAKAKPENHGRWYVAARDALTALGVDGAVRTLEQGVARYGADPSRLRPVVTAAADAPSPAPDWLARAPAEEPGTVRPLRPSGDVAQDAAVSPLARGGGMGRFRRGLLIHRLLQVLPDLPLAERREAAQRMLGREPGLPAGAAEEMIAAAFGVLDDPVFAAVFAPGSRPEAAIAARLGGFAINGQIDRLVVDKARVLVADFKTNRPAPARIEDADPAYIRQMAAYVAVLREAYPGKAVEAALIWTDGPQLMPIPEFLVSRALAELGLAS